MELNKAAPNKVQSVSRVATAANNAPIYRQYNAKVFHIQIRVLRGGPFYVETLSREEGSLGLPELPWGRQRIIDVPTTEHDEPFT